MYRGDFTGQQIGLRVLILIAAMLSLAPVHAADADIAYAAAANTGAYQEFDLGAASNSSSALTSAPQISYGGTGGAPGTAVAAGTYGNASSQTRRVSHPGPRTTGRQGVAMAPARTAILDRTFGRLMVLPPTSTDSFVLNSAGNADLIYGDEGYDGPPPFYGFDESHRIERGIYNPGLTTGHRSALPEAWGYPN